MKLASIVPVAFAAQALGRSITVYNACPFTIWPATFTGDRSRGVPSYATGWSAAAWTAVKFNVPDNWTAGRIWARRNCNFPTSNGATACLTGSCNGGMECDPVTGTGVPPATLAEWTLSAADGLDWYDVSLVDGYNLPVRITNNVGCPTPECAVDLGPDCPAPLRGPFDSSGFPVGCSTACTKHLASDPANDPNCCTGRHNTAATCPPSGVQYYDYFKSRCPTAYAYAYDEGSGTALWTCQASKKADYTLTFCPPP